MMSESLASGTAQPTLDLGYFQQRRAVMASLQNQTGFILSRQIMISLQIARTATSPTTITFNYMLLCLEV